MTTTTSMPVTPLTGVAVVSGSTWAGLTPMVVAMDAGRLLLPGRVVDGRRGLAGGGVDRCLHRPAAGADDRRVVRGQPVGARAVGHHDAHRARGDGGRRRGRPLWPALVVVVCRAAVVVVVARRRRPRWSSWSPPPAAAVVVVVVLGVLLTLGRVPTATRTATATTKRMRPPPPGRSRVSRTILSAAGRHPLSVQPALHPRPKQAFPLVGQGRGGGPVAWAAAPE